MKKTLVALAVTAIAASANAATVYEKDGSRIDVEGSFRLFLGKDSKSQRTDLKNNGSRVWVKANQEIGNGLSALGAVEFRFDEVPAGSDNTFGNPRARQLYAGFAHKDVGTVTFGRQETTLDLVQLSDFAYPFGGNNNLTDYAEKSVKFTSAEFHGLTIGADYLFGNAKKNDATPALKYGYGFSAFYTRELAKDVTFNFAAGYEQTRFDDADALTTTTGTKGNAWRTAAQIVFGKAALGVEFGRNVEKANGQAGRDRFILVGAKYQVIEPSAVYFQYQNNQEKAANSAKETKNKYILGVDYKLHSNVVVFVEGYRSLEKKHTAPVVKSNDTGYGVGLRVLF